MDDDKSKPAAAGPVQGAVRPCNRSETMTVEEFFAEAKRLNLRMLGTPEKVRAALDAKDAEIHRLRMDLENTRAEAVLAVRAAQAAERERLIRMVEARAQTHNGPHLLTLELNQIAAWMAGKSWHGVQPPRA